jgi:hypothetical protein
MSRIDAALHLLLCLAIGLTAWTGGGGQQASDGKGEEGMALEHGVLRNGPPK